MFNCSCYSALSWWFKTFNLLICMDFICFDSIEFSNGQITDHDIHGEYIPAWWVRGHVYKCWNLVPLPCIYFLLARCGGLSPQNVQVTYSRGRVNAQFPTGTVAFFTCNEGYYRGIKQNTTCLPSGNWEQPIPMCYQSNQFSFIILV